ncbi:MAG TPA: branched-chain amino acid aminotransferase [Candidatus Dormibacteraeota bacterium]
MSSSATAAFELHSNPSPASDEERRRLLENPGFGRVFTDHMVSIDWNRDDGWHNFQIEPYAPLQLDPATIALHYSQAVFEGLKAYPQPDGSVAVFRPDQNARRFHASARRLALPELPEAVFLESIRRLISVDRAWVPTSPGQSLYLRPLLFGTDLTLEVHPSTTARFLLLASPVGSYFKGGIKPVSVWLTEEFSRAAPGGTGAAKFGGNYGASLLAQQEAVDNGCDQVVWLDAATHTIVEEMGGMNLFFVYGSRLLTPALTGTLLAGVTRDSLLTLARDLDFEVEEGTITVDEWRAACADGRMTETFACGTAAVVTPVARVKSSRDEWQIGDGQAGEVTMSLREALVGIQTGAAPDLHGWLWPV